MKARVYVDDDSNEKIVYDNNEDIRITDCSKPGIPKDAAGKDKSGKIMVADFTTFNSYFFDRKHGNMRNNIYEYLNEALECGELDQLTKRKIITEHLTMQCYTLDNLRFWGIDRSSFYTDIEIKIDLDTSEGVFNWQGMLRCFCRFNPDFECDIYGMDKEFEHKGLTRLSSYLVPVYKNIDVDYAAERIWEWYGMKEALTNPKARDAKELARRMGLKIQYIPIYEHNGIDSIVFFSEGELVVGQDFLVKDENGKNVRCKDNKPRKIKIPADTIVVNTNCIKREYSDFNIFHECIHYTKHYLAMRLQELACNDTRKIKTKELTPEEAEDYKDPLFFMENQANRGAFGLMMPIKDTQHRIYQEMASVRSYRHLGELYDIVGIALCRTLELPRFRIRARMIQLGHIEAVGAMNYVDYKRVRPFAFDKENFLVEEHVFTISEFMLKNLCYTNGELRKLINSGKYIYAGGHVVRNLPNYVTKVSGEYELTDWANKNVDKCCLRFTRQYVQNRVGHFVLGHLCCDLEYMKRTLFFLNDTMVENGVDEIDARDIYIRNFPLDFKGALKKLKKQTPGATDMVLAEYFNMDDSTFRRIIDDPKRYKNEDFLVMLCLFFQLPDWLSDLLFRRAHYQLDDDLKRHRVMKELLRACSCDGIDAANEYLVKHKCDPLCF